MCHPAVTNTISVNGCFLFATFVREPLVRSSDEARPGRLREAALDVAYHIVFVTFKRKLRVTSRCVAPAIHEVISSVE